MAPQSPKPSFGSNSRQSGPQIGNPFVAFIAEKLGIPLWGQLLLVALALAGATVVVQIFTMNGRLSHIEGELQILTAGKLVSDAAISAQSGNPQKAALLLDRSAKAIGEAQHRNLSAPPQFFQDAVDALRVIYKDGTSNKALTSAASETNSTLAAYRTSLNPSPRLNLSSSAQPLQGDEAFFRKALQSGRSVYRISGSILLKNNVGGFYSEGAVLNGTGLPPGKDLFQRVFEGPPVSDPIVSGLFIVARQQTLDNISWHNVTFVDTHVIYNGGTISLTNVTFVNCTFSVSANQSGRQLLDYASLDQKTLQIPG